MDICTVACQMPSASVIKWVCLRPWLYLWGGQHLIGKKCFNKNFTNISEFASCCWLLSGQLRGHITETPWEQFSCTTLPTVSRLSTLTSGWTNFDSICCLAKPSMQSLGTKQTWHRSTGQWRRPKVGDLPPAAVASTSLKLRRRRVRTSRRCSPPSHGTFIRCWNAERFRSRKAGMGSRQDSVMVTPVCDCVCPAPGLRGPEQTAAVDGYWTIVPVKWLKFWRVLFAVCVAVVICRLPVCCAVAVLWMVWYASYSS